MAALRVPSSWLHDEVETSKQLSPSYRLTVKLAILVHRNYKCHHSWPTSGLLYKMTFNDENQYLFGISKGHSIDITCPLFRQHAVCDGHFVGTEDICFFITAFC